MAVVPKDAATIVFIRDATQSQAGVEVLMVRRHIRSDFAGGAYVFPGGAVETADYAPQMEEICTGLTLQRAQNIIRKDSYPEKALGFFVAAIREAFEEVRILLAYQDSHKLIAFGEEQERQFNEYRAQMQEKRLSFEEMIRREGLTLATDRLFYFAHWITPEISPSRFDTHFFVALAPPAQEPLYDALEITAARWVTPKEALEGYKRKEFPLLPPTLSNLEIIAKFLSVEQVIASIQDKEVPTILPRVVVEDGQMKLQITEDLAC